jgi:adenylosuccinate lyase
MQAWDENQDFQQLAQKDKDINGTLTPAEIERVFALDTYLRNVDRIFERVFVAN